MIEVAERKAKHRKNGLKNRSIRKSETQEKRRRCETAESTEIPPRRSQLSRSKPNRKIG
jgi:hypothetical protein